MMNEITELREKLNSLIENGASKEEIYAVSTELDKLIIKYYKENAQK